MSHIHTIFDKPRLNGSKSASTPSSSSSASRNSEQHIKAKPPKKTPKFSFATSKGHVLGNVGDVGNLPSISSTSTSSSSSSSFSTPFPSHANANPWAPAFRNLTSSSSSISKFSAPLDQLNSLLPPPTSNRSSGEIHRNEITGRLVVDMDSALPDAVLSSSGKKGSKRRGGKMTEKGLIQSINKLGQETAADREIAMKLKEKRQKDLPMNGKVREWAYVEAQTINVKIECRADGIGCGKKINLSDLKLWWKISTQANNKIPKLPTNTFEVENVLCQKKSGRTTLYFVKWKGFSESENTWEPAGNLVIGFTPEELNNLPSEKEYKEQMKNQKKTHKQTEEEDEMEEKYSGEKQQEEDNWDEEEVQTSGDEMEERANKKHKTTTTRTAKRGSKKETIKEEEEEEEEEENGQLKKIRSHISNSDFPCPVCNGPTSVNLVINALYIDGNSYKERVHYAKGKELIELLESYRQFHLEEAFHVTRLCACEDEEAHTILWSLAKEYGKVSDGLKKIYGQGRELEGKGIWKDFNLYEDGK